jgi:hypothetical protein
VVAGPVSRSGRTVRRWRGRRFVAAAIAFLVSYSLSIVRSRCS